VLFYIPMQIERESSNDMRGCTVGGGDGGRKFEK
jgi:hypothetical protein